MTTKPKIALVSGGYSKEKSISYLSAKVVYKNIPSNEFDVYWVDISKNKWAVKHKNKKYLLSKEDFSFTILSKKIKFDLAFICIHGTPGEDGKLQGYFDMIDLPYTGCNTTASALTFNKRYTLASVKLFGVNIAKSVHLIKNNPISIPLIQSQLPLPVFVKPNNGGSSFGITKVKNYSDLPAAINKAFNEDNEVLIEETIVGRELTIGVYKIKDKIITLPPIEIISKNEYFDFAAKYQGQSQEICPADINSNHLKKIQLTAKKIYENLGLRGVVRIDFILQKNTNKLFMLEINTVPGQTIESLVPKELKAANITLTNFYRDLIIDALNY